MKTYQLTLSPKTAFGSPILGETLFGQLCIEIFHGFGEGKLQELLQGYTQGQPFAVISDAFPSGYIPLPSLPGTYWPQKPNDNRKALKKKAWIPLSLANQPSLQWRDNAFTDTELAGELWKGKKLESLSIKTDDVVAHNSINRLIQMTGEGMFAPYLQTKLWFLPGIHLDVYVVVDETRFSKEELVLAFRNIGLSGYGRDVSAGLGKFDVVGEISELPKILPSCSRLALASVVLEGLTDVESSKTFYQVKTHFGRHGGGFALTGNPFKNPLLLAKSGAVITFKTPHDAPFIGKGISGVSAIKSETIHQGYSPVLALSEIREM